MYEFRLPDLQLEGIPVQATVWHVGVGGRVQRGHRLLEVVAGDILLELAAPVSGRLREQRVLEDDTLQTGDLLALIDVSSAKEPPQGGGPV